jgi:hypothetical protein
MAPTSKKDVLDAYCREIQAEHTLISHRMSWFSTSQSFLFTAFAISGSPNNEWNHLLSFLMPILGIVLTELARRSIWAAIIVQDDLINEQKVLIESLEKECRDSAQSEVLGLWFKTMCYRRRTNVEFHNVATDFPHISTVKSPNFLLAP